MCKSSPVRAPDQGYCLKCACKYQRENRKRHSELPELERKKANARSYANVYLRRGKLDRKPCEVCGDTKVQMHHEDYDKPLQVRWLCKNCHLTEHATTQ